MVPSSALVRSIEWMRKHFDPDAALGVSAVYQFELTGAGGGELVLRVDDGVARIQAGRDPSAAVRLRLDAGDCLAILAGRENADLLYLAGRLEIEGDLSLAMKLRSLLRRR